jgi:DNA-binding transcriptional ArsR family regulator
MDIDAIHKALANPVRRDILHWLKDPHEHFAQQEHPLDIGVCAGLIDARTGLSQSTVSSHLATLQRAGLVTRAASANGFSSNGTRKPSRPSSTT